MHAPKTPHGRHSTLSEPQLSPLSAAIRAPEALGGVVPPDQPEGVESGGDPPRPPRAAGCPFLRFESSGALFAPGNAPSEDHRCLAIAGPRDLSRQQQELVCLRAAHVDCPRYRRATAGATPTAGGRVNPTPRLHPATTVALIVLALSAGISFGFVIQRGGIDLPAAALLPSAGTAAVPGSLASGSAPARPSPSDIAPGAIDSPSAPPATRSPSPSPAPVSTLSPKPAPTPVSGGVPSPDRMAVIKPCPGQPDCWVYSVRAGDNLWSIAHWFGVPLDTVYAWNPTVKQTGIHPGTPLKIPTPTR